MCRILSYAGEIDDTVAAKLLDDFRKLAACGNVPKGATKGHRDGWGIAGYKNGAVSFFEKAPQDASADMRYVRAAERVVLEKPEIMMAHVRKSSVGKNKKENTHPFAIGDFAFCHNGTIFNKARVPLQKRYRDLMQGETDSELFFLYIIQLYRASHRKTNVAMTQAITQAVLFARENLEYTALNVMLSDGRSLWALREISADSAIVRKKKLMNYYTLYTSETKSDIAICSEKIASKQRRWRALRNHELIRFDIKTRKRTSAII